MNFTNGFAKDDFLQHMFEEFPTVFNNNFSRTMLENIVNYGTADNFTHTKNDLYYFLKNMIPEVEPGDLIPFIDKSCLTNEVLMLSKVSLDDKIKIVDAKFVSIWDGGFAVETNCKVNLQTREVFDIEVSENSADFVNELDEEFIRFSNGTEFTVGQNGAECDFWYGAEDIINMDPPFTAFMSDKDSLINQIKFAETRAGSQQRISTESLNGPVR